MDIDDHDKALSDLLGKISLDDIPDSLFVSNLPESIFQSDEIKHKFEHLFIKYNPTNILYFEKFQTCRIYFNSSKDAAKARISFHMHQFENKILKLSFPEVNLPEGGQSTNLELPHIEKCFLISPPASPPVGWEPITEHEPVVDLQVLSALANLEPGKSHQLCAGTASTPSVVVHVCETIQMNNFPKTKIPQTRRPNFEK